jgi:hypothetical protein
MAAGLCRSGGATWRRRRNLGATAAGSGEDHTVVTEGRGTLLQLEGVGNKKGGEVPTEVKPTARGAAVAPRQFPTRGGGIQRRKAAPGRVGARGRGRGFGAARPTRREGIGKGGARWLLHGGGGKAGAGSGRVHVGGGRRRGGVRCGSAPHGAKAAWGRGTWWPARRVASRGGRQSATCEQGRGGWRAWAVRGGVGRPGRGESWNGPERNSVIFYLKRIFKLHKIFAIKN